MSAYISFHAATGLSRQRVALGEFWKFVGYKLDLQSKETNLQSETMFSFAQQNAVEPMQVDAPAEDNDNTEEEPYIVENPTLVSKFHIGF